MLHDDRPEIVTDKSRRPVEAGDVLILVRSRSPLFRQIIAALKARGLPIAGVDRSALTAPLAAQDLLSLMRFLATPEDSLSLAEVLRSPIGGWSEDDLFRLSHGRKGYLWEALRNRAEERVDWTETHAMLRDLRNEAEFKRPYDLLERALVRHDARRRLIARLGGEAEDGIDAMLSQALAYERMEVPSLTGFIGWLEAGEVTVKRDLAQAKGQIRVMTVHGAKGLEAPVVILPDTGVARGGGAWRAACPRRRRARLLADLARGGGGPRACRAGRGRRPRPGRAQPAALRGADPRRKLADRRRRRQPDRRSREASGDMVRRGRGRPSGSGGPNRSTCRGLEGEGLRLQSGTFAHAGPSAQRPASEEHAAALPEWATQPAAPVLRDTPALSPSDLGGDKVLPGVPEAALGRGALRRGRLVHLMLEHLPNVPPPGWRDAAPRIAKLEAPDVSDPRTGRGLRRGGTRPHRAPPRPCLRARHAGRGRAPCRQRGAGRHCGWAPSTG